MQEVYDKAEPLFRKATELEPGYARAWRFLEDCYTRMGRVKDAEKAAFGAVAADPGDYTAWARLRQARAALRKTELVKFQMPKVTASAIKKDVSGKDQIIVPTEMTGTTPEARATLAYSLMIPMMTISDQKPENAAKVRSALEREATAWKAAMEVYEKVLAEGKASPVNASWSNLLAFHKADQLREAVMILKFKEAYRSDFETWKKTHPGAIETFIEKWQLRP